MFTVAGIINKHLIKFLVAIIAIGIATGYYYPELGTTLQPFTPVAIFVMLYPMMIGMKIEEVTKAAKQWKLLSVAMIFNYIVSPLLGGILAALFLPSYPEFAVGLILTSIVPCGGMVVAWTGLSRGNTALAMVFFCAKNGRI